MELGCRRAPDTGTSVEVTSDDRPSLESPSAPGARGHRILVVEDDLDSRLLVESAIAQTGFGGEVDSTIDARARSRESWTPRTWRPSI